MDQKTNRSLELFYENYRVMRECFQGEFPLAFRLGAMMATLQNHQLTCNCLHKGFEVLKAQAPAFSEIRTIGKIMASSLCVTEDADSHIRKTLKVYTTLKEQGFFPSEFLALAACVVAKRAPEERFSEIVQRAWNFYLGFRDNHPYLAGSDDIIYTCLLGLSQLPVEQTLEQIESLYESLFPILTHKKGVLSLAIVLVLIGAKADDTKRVLELRDVLKDKNLRFDKPALMPMLGCLSLLHETPEVVAWQIQEIKTDLRRRRGFSSWMVEEKQLLMYCTGILVSDKVSPEEDPYQPSEITLAKKMAYFWLLMMTNTVVSVNSQQ